MASVTKGTKIGLWIGAAAVLALLYGGFDPEQFAFFPKCPFYALTGWECPGCGSQRALHALLHGHPGEAFGHNPLAVAALPYLGLAAYLDCFGGKTRYPRLRKIFMGREACFAILGAVLLFGIGRNFL